MLTNILAMSAGALVSLCYTLNSRNWPFWAAMTLYIVILAYVRKG